MSHIMSNIQCAEIVMKIFSYKIPWLRDLVFQEEIAQVCEIKYGQPVTLLLVFLDFYVEFLHPPDQGISCDS